MDKPFLYVFILAKIKNHTNTEFVDVNFLKENIGRIIIRKGGLPRFMVKYIISDMVDLGLIDMINQRGLYKLNKVVEENKIKMLMV